MKIWKLENGPYPFPLLLIFHNSRKDVNAFLSRRFRLREEVIDRNCKGFAGWIDEAGSDVRVYFIWMSEWDTMNSFDHMILAHELTHMVGNMMKHLGIEDPVHEADAYIQGWLHQQCIELLSKGEISQWNKKKKIPKGSLPVPGAETAS